MALGRRQKEGLLWIDPQKILPAMGQPRTVFREDALQELAQSIADHGILQPLVVLQEGEHYRLIAGERRLRASKLAGMKTVPCLLTEKDPEEAAKLSLIENLQREDLSFFEEAAAYRRLMEQFGLSQVKIAQEMSKDPSTIANKLRLLRLPLSAQILITQSGLTERHARALLKIEDPDLLMDTLEQIIDDALNVQQTETLISSLCAPQAEKEPSKKRGTIKDVRLCINTLNHTVQTLKQAGIKLKTQINDGEQLVEYIIRIPKTS
jgi:ParB family chromosome partitioning protein